MTAPAGSEDAGPCACYHSIRRHRMTSDGGCGACPCDAYYEWSDDA